MKQKTFAISVIFLVFLLDQWTKFLVLGFLELFPLTLTSFFNLVFVQNKGITFGFLQAHSTLQIAFLIGIAFVISTIIGYFLWTSKKKRETLAYAAILGGALGNILDRIRFGAVTDFLDFHIGIYHWPAFNIADSAIVIGVILILVTQTWQVKDKI